MQCSDLRCSLPITMKFRTRHNSVTVVTCAKFCCDRIGIIKARALNIFIEFELDRNAVIGRVTRSASLALGNLTIPLCQWSSHDRYWYISHVINHKTQKAQTRCMFLDEICVTSGLLDIKNYVNLSKYIQQYNKWVHWLHITLPW